uniref:Uncharacterized protein n=1 Tax=Arundo donax TaxID=35708 RepID=A0A0A9CCQ8_ARUDO
MGFDFVVEYKPGSANTVADALSRRDAIQQLFLLCPCQPLNFGRSYEGS